MLKQYNRNKQISASYRHLCCKLGMKFGYYEGISRLPGPLRNLILNDLDDLESSKRFPAMHIN